MVKLPKINRCWADEPCIIAAPGPSLTPDVVLKVRLKRWVDRWRIIAVNDAYKVLQHADVLYACDGAWWDVHQRCEGFTGERWSCHEQDPDPAILHGNDKRRHAQQYGIHLVSGRDGDEFSLDAHFIRYGSNSGFQAINLALLFGARRIVLVGFDMRHVDGKSHFFGDHPPALCTRDDAAFRGFIRHFQYAAAQLPPGVSIVNATPDSALTCFPMMSFEDATRALPQSDGRLHRHGAEPHTAAG